MDDKVKDLLDRIRGTASVAADAAADTARVAGKKAGQMVDVAKLNVQLFDLNGDYNEVMRQLGQVMYDTHKGQAPEGDPVTQLLEKAEAFRKNCRSKGPDCRPAPGPDLSRLRRSLREGRQILPYLRPGTLRRNRHAVYHGTV